ncbi:MAG TPA: LptA/OstA family protein [Stellaceae bacterium]|jgi:lipopolysaccharide export system protein LptA
MTAPRAAAAAAALLVFLCASGVPGSAPRAQQPQQPAAPGQGLGLGQQQDGRPTEIEADQGIEWRQNEQVYIARGNARVTRGNNTVYADTLTAYYRPVRPASAGGAAPASAPASTPAPAGGGSENPTGGSTEIYRVVADGHVRVTTPTQTVYGDHGVYDLDTAIVVMTGKGLKLVTPRDIVTARDSLEWYDRKQFAVARGDAVAIQEAKRVKADVLMAQVIKPDDGPSRISRVDAQGHVFISTPSDIARGDTGVYNVDTGIATLANNVTITRGDNQLRGQYGVVDLNKNVSRLLPGPPNAVAGGGPSRVEGLLIPRQRAAAGAPNGGEAPPPPDAAAPDRGQ